MKHTVAFWMLAFLITAGSAVYQRITGPTWPISGKTVLAGREVSYRLERSHAGDTDAGVLVLADDPSISGVLRWKRYKTGDDWTERPMARRGPALSGTLPHQPPAGKLAYSVDLLHGKETITVPAGDPVVIRFRGDVPFWVLIPHVIAMFGAMLLSTRTGLEALRHTPSYGRLVPWTLALLAAGGLALGPLVQKFAFDAYWTGWPFGTDLTDNKTAVAFLGWLAAAIALRRSARPDRWVLGAALLLLAVYLIPHSLLGSELDYTTLPPPSQAP